MVTMCAIAIISDAQVATIDTELIVESFEFFATDATKVGILGFVAPETNRKERKFRHVNVKHKLILKN